jgi:hypothetical protein
MTWLINILWPFKNKNKELLEKIEQHRKITEQANITIDKFQAALDGENKWFECGCQEIGKKEKHNGTLPDSSSRKCHS